MDDLNPVDDPVPTEIRSWCARCRELLRITLAGALEREKRKQEKLRKQNLDPELWMESSDGQSWAQRKQDKDQRTLLEGWLGATEEEQTSIKKRFPSIKLGGKLSTKDLDFWEKHLCSGETPVSLVSLVDGLLQHELKQGEQDFLRVSLVSLASKGLQIQISSNDEKASPVYLEGTKTVDPNAQPFSCVLEFNPAASGGGTHAKLVSLMARGRGRQVMSKSLLPCLKSLKVQTFSLEASGLAASRDGCLAWARYGFVPSEKDWDLMRDKGLDGLLNVPALECCQQELLLALEDANPESLKRLMALTWKYKANQEVGPVLTEFVNSLIPLSWEGSIDLGDPRCEQWITCYAENRSDTDYMALLPEPSKERTRPQKRNAEPSHLQDEPEQQGLPDTPDEREAALLPVMLLEWIGKPPQVLAESVEEYLLELQRTYSPTGQGLLLDLAGQSLAEALREKKFSLDAQGVDASLERLLGEARMHALRQSK